MPSPQEILYNRTFQPPSKPSTPVDMKSVKNYLLSCKQSQKAQFDRAHGDHELPELGQGQEVLLQSPVKDEYIPRTITDRATMAHSYIVEAQGKGYSRMREHLWQIHLNLPTPASHQPIPPKPKVPITCIPKPNPKIKHTLHPVSLPGPSLQPSCHIPCPPQPYISACNTNAAPSVKDLL